jgi:hypothetical protein
MGVEGLDWGWCEGWGCFGGGGGSGGGEEWNELYEYSVLNELLYDCGGG